MKKFTSIVKPIYMILLFLAMYGKLFAQPPVKLEHYSTEDGLSHDIITCMFKDREGYMWFGTWNGINRFDGHQFTAFTSVPGDKSQIKNDRIDQIFEDAANHLWIKSYDGEVYRFDKDTEQFTPLSEILSLKKKIVFDRILSADDGMLWVSTVSNGLIAVADVTRNRSPYYTFANSKNKGANTQSETVNFFYRQAHNKLWVGTTQGLIALTRKSSGTFDVRQVATNTSFTAVAGNSQNLYFGTAAGVLFAFNASGKALKQVLLGKGKINALHIGKITGELYASSSGGALITYNPQSGTVREDSTGGDAFFSIFEDRTGSLWLQPEKRGVTRYETKNKTFTTFGQKNDASSMVPRNHFKVFEDKNGTVWSVLRDGGFGYYDTAAAKFRYFYNEPGAATRRMSNLVAVAFYDPAGVMWLHTDQRGLEKVIFNPNDFKQRLLADPGLFKSDNEVRGMLSDRQNRLWVGAKSNLLYVYKNGQQQNITFTGVPQGGMGAVYTIFQTKAGIVWLGTKEKGLFKATPLNAEETSYRLTQYRHDAANPGSLSSDQVYSVIEDAKGRLLVGTFDTGLNIMNPSVSADFKHYYDGSNGYPNRFHKIRHLALDGQGRLWIGSTDGLVIGTPKGDQFTFNTYSKQPGSLQSIGNNDIQYILKDHKNRMWLASSGGGLNLALGKPQTGMNFKVYSTKNGLGSNYTLSIKEDRTGKLWIATKSGLSKFDPEKESFHNFNSYDGVPNDGFSEGSSVETKDGLLVFGTIRGILTFDPAKIQYHPIQSNIVFTGLQVNNEDVDLGDPQKILTKDINHTDQITLKYNQNIISLDYTVLDYRSGNRQAYLYRLKGFDSTWHDNKDQRRATYTNLPPGDYQFEVKSPDPENYTNVPARQLNITILPPPWKTWWAYLIYLILFVIAVEVTRRIVMTMLHLRQGIAVEQKMTALKMAFFTNVSHELRTPLTLILNPIDEILKKEKLSEQGLDYVAIVRRNAMRMVLFVNQLLDLRKAQSGQAKLTVSDVELTAFVSGIAENFKEEIRANEIDFKVFADGEINLSLDADKMEIVIYNLLSNSFKFSSPGTSISVVLNDTLKPGMVCIMVADQGCGVPDHDLEHIFQLYHESVQPETQQMKGTGIGLALAKEMVELHGGTISATNREQGGLMITILLPMQQTGHVQRTISEEPATSWSKIADKAETQQQQEVKIPALIEAEELTDAKLILLVEDNEDMRAFLMANLRSMYRIQAAADGVEGLALARKIQPDIILSDIMMPKMDGIEMLDQLKNDPLTSHIPVILLSAKSAVESQITGLRYGADFYISKPFDNELLYAAIANIIEQRQRLVDRLVSGQKLVELSPGQVMVTSRDELFLQKVIEIVEEKMADPDFNIDTVAEMINMARATFFKKFKSLTQQAPVEFVRIMRIKRARQHLDAGSGNITEVAYAVGFSSAKYFATCFKAEYGMSPSEYLKSTRPQDSVV
ncbi:hybrid sensor histidine kinase/response regulator transcription factor [Pedobacter duraquae]|uniref:histidine kinase n=1 Tax=Pedobacter duraquae TaxID=425511 RepID=A0A4R6IQH2_9SPHI|nr:two-component regulator propeller domain-containing protein [Pedobacter duraquae]TDO24215.1 two component regulator with propeller domain [Pedobacter duraquae]